MIQQDKRHLLPKVVIAGVTGFIGRHLARSLHSKYYIIGLSRVAGSKKSGSDPHVDEWRSCDLFSLLETQIALVGADYAYYLVHSMMPSTRLTQGDFWNFDLIAADNFARAAAHVGIKQIIYLGGLVPSGVLSRHLESRLEVEKTLGAYATPLTALRAGMVIGAEGSSFLTMVRAVEKAPFLLFPKWANTVSHPIALEDVIRLLVFCLGNEKTFQQAFDIGGPELMSYRRLMETICKALGVKKVSIRMPVGRTRLLSRILGLLTGAPKELVDPLVESLRHAIVARERKLNLMAELPGVHYKDAITQAVREIQEGHGTLHSKPVAYQKSRVPIGVPSVRSVQRFPLPPGKTAEWVARRYLTWLPTWIRFVLRVEMQDEVYTIILNLGRPVQLLILQRRLDHSWPDLQLFTIEGGVLAKKLRKGRLEFREVLGGKAVLAAIHDYSPALPWYIYVYTQAWIHLVVMRSFNRYLRGAKS